MRNPNGTFSAVHGQWRTPTYRAWERMIQRCHNRRNQKYRWYGGLGVTVCHRWRRSFTAFFEDMGAVSDGLTLDRIDSTGNYAPGNCRWATWEQQRANTRRSYGLEEFLAHTGGGRFLQP